jgi:hypothetical protein
MEQDQNSREEEVAPQDQEPTPVDQNSESDKDNAVDESHDLDDKQEKNWKELRRKQREFEFELEAKNKLIKDLLEARQAHTVPKEPEKDEFEGIAPDDYPTWDLTNKKIAKEAEAIAERKFRELEKRKEQERFRERLMAKYEDFDDVVNLESIGVFEKKYPELANTIADLKDPYKIGLQTYHYIKAFNLSDDVSQRRRVKEVDKKLEKNEKTVQSPQAFDKRPMAQAFRNTNAERAALYEEMMSYASQAGGY